MPEISNPNQTTSTVNHIHKSATADNPPLLAIVVPCYNEEAAILTTINTLSSLLEKHISANKISSESFLLSVDDGSTDQTITLLRNFKKECYKVIKLSKNSGQQFALLAGLQYATGKADCAISIDADLQDDLSVIEKMITKYNNGAHIVCGVRSNRNTDSFFKKYSAKVFYKMMNTMGVGLIENHADFRLLSHKALFEIAKYKESNLFLRGIFPILNLQLETISYTRQARTQGRTKYGLMKMITLALRGITAFSNVPIRLISILGFLIFIVSLILIMKIMLVFMRGSVIPHWASITLPMYFLGGIQLLSLGVIGEYISNIYTETKRRPHFHIEEIIE